MSLRNPWSRIKSHLLRSGNARISEIEELEGAIEEHTRETKGFDPRLIREYRAPSRKNVFIDENVLIDLKRNNDRATTTYFPLNPQSDNTEKKRTQRVDISEPLEKTIMMLEEVANQNREMFYASTLHKESQIKEGHPLPDFLKEYGTPVEIEEIPGTYPEDLGVVAEAVDRDAVIVTYDRDFLAEDEILMQHSPEIYTPSQYLNTIKED